MQSETKRKAELSVDLEATPAAIWKLLTDAEELSRWFPVQATVKPGAGGSILNVWNTEMSFESPITIWEPNKRLRLLWGPPPAPGTPESELFGVDFFIEDRGGGVTRLRLVHFGFGTGGHWDSMYDGVSRGWDFMLWGLTEYMEKHLGTPRNVVFLQAKLGDRPNAQAWESAFDTNGIVPASGVRTLKKGEKFRVEVGGQEIRGQVRVNIPGKDFQASIESLNGAHFRLQVDACHNSPGEQLSVTLATFGIDPGRIEQVRMTWVDRLARMFG